jgi:DNA-binding Xre family transcriptional regulator
MIYIDLFPIVELRGGAKVTSYLVQKGFTYGEARTLMHGKKLVQVRDVTVFRLCEALQCTPSDLFGWSGADTDALAVLNTRRPKPIYALMEGLNYEERVAFWKKLEALSLEHPKKPEVLGGKLLLNVRRLVRFETLKSPLQELQRRGLTEMEARAVLSDWRAGLRMGVLTKLCRAFACLPDDLYAFTGPEGHVLSGLRRTGFVEQGMVSDEVMRGLMGVSE